MTVQTGQVATTQSVIFDCDSEPIHIPGAIQPHGALVAVLVRDEVISHASANLEIHVGFAAAAVLGRPVSILFGDEVGQSIVDACRGSPVTTETIAAQARDGSPLQLNAFRSGDYLCVDIEPIRNKLGQDSLIGMAQSVVEPMREAADRTELCELAVSGLKRILGYDRVMAYRFAEDGHGEVIAEVREPRLEPYLGLRYPASDIPPQARLLYTRKRVGAIVDSRYTAVALIVETSRAHPPLDLTMSGLRSVSPVHCEYMRNMGTAASLTIGLPDRGALLGMLVCHHETPRTTGPGHRAVADIVGQIVSLLLQTLGAGETNAQRLERDIVLRSLTRKLSAPIPLLDAIGAAESEFLDVVDASGAIVKFEGEFAVLGSIPPLESARQALALLEPRAEGGFLACDDLALRYPELSACAEAGSGALFLSRRNDIGDAILWFRPEFKRTVKWGGNPSDANHPDASRMSPRTSFAAWSETVSGHARTWSEVDLALARELGFALTSEVGRRAKAELARLRHYDSLTGLPNRSLLNERLAEMRNEMTASVSLLFFDLDLFKAVNDTLGHAAGDALLVEVARRISEVIGADHTAARLGGDEFVVLGRMEPTEAVRIAEAIRRTIAAPFDVAGKTCSVATSIGIAHLGQCGRFDLIQAADMAMYASKQEGGNRATSFDIAMYDRTAREFELERDFRNALHSDGQLVLFYQPVYSLGSEGNTLVAFEALLRWHHPRQGWMKPEQVIPLAERLGLMIPLGNWILERAVRAGRQLQQALHRSLSISVNVSRQELSDRGFGARLQSLLQAENHAPATLCLEVTEGTLRDGPALAVLEELQSVGVQIAIDEFGIGYSSLSYLRRVPVDVVKLDGSFLVNVDGDTRAVAL